MIKNCGKECSLSSTGTQRSFKYWEFNCGHLSMASSWLRSVASRANDIVAETAAAVRGHGLGLLGEFGRVLRGVEGEEPDGAAAAAARTGGRGECSGSVEQNPRGKDDRCRARLYALRIPSAVAAASAVFRRREVPQQRCSDTRRGLRNFGV